MKIRATFKGKNMSLGYETNKEYELKVCDNQAVCIVRLDGTGRCYYSTLHKFLENWENIKKIV